MTKNNIEGTWQKSWNSLY